MRKSGLALTIIALILAACGGGASGDEWASFRGELVVQGISTESISCVIAQLETNSFEPGDFTTAADAETLAAGQAAYDAASLGCFNDQEVDGLVESQIEAVLPDIAAGLGITTEQARCVVDGLEGEGVSFAEVARGDGNPAVTAAITTLLPRCTGTEAPADAPAPTPAQASAPVPTEAPAEDAPIETAPADDAAVPDASSSFDTDEMRQLMISGIASGSGYSTEVAECILDTTLAQGLTMDDFVLRGGDDDVIAAITTAGATCVNG